MVWSLYIRADNTSLTELAEDVFRARLKTVGVCEYKFEMEAGFESGTEWRIIDVGGSRSQVCIPLYRLFFYLTLTPFLAT